jgi:hypothetical protein
MKQPRVDVTSAETQVAIIILLRMLIQNTISSPLDRGWQNLHLARQESVVEKNKDLKVVHQGNAPSIVSIKGFLDFTSVGSAKEVE